VTLFMFFTSAVISHNHNHWDVAFEDIEPAHSYVIALFYGHPAVAWVRRTTRCITS